MAKLFAFLRAINVGGHTVKMERLRSGFEDFGLVNVETFIASGNCIFDEPGIPLETLETGLEKHIENYLGFPCAVFIRTEKELAAIAIYQAFPKEMLERAVALNIAFLHSSLDEMAVQKLYTKATEIDDFHFHGREIYWLCKNKQSQSTFSNAVLEKTIRVQSTLRGAATIQKMAGKYSLA